MAAALATIAMVLSTVYASWVYGDWTCGLPGVECRRIAERSK